MNNLKSFLQLINLIALVGCSSVSRHEGYTPSEKAIEIKENTPIHRAWNRYAEIKRASYLVDDKVLNEQGLVAVLGNSPDKKVTKKVKDFKFYQAGMWISYYGFFWATLDYVGKKIGVGKDEKEEIDVSDNVKAKSLQLTVLTGAIFGYFLYKKNQSLDEGVSIHNKRIGDKDILTTLNYRFKF